MYRKNIVLVLIVLLGGYKLLAQNKNNTVYLEAFGLGGYGSLNYERRIYNFNKQPLHLTTSIGIGSFKQKDIYHHFNPDVIIPVSVNLHWQHQAHSAELGFANTFTSILQMDLSQGVNQYRSYFVNGGFILGYRFHFIRKPSMYFRVAYTPILEYYQHFRHWGGVSLGIKF